MRTGISVAVLHWPICLQRVYPRCLAPLSSSLSTVSLVAPSPLDNCSRMLAASSRPSSEHEWDVNTLEGGGKELLEKHLIKLQKGGKKIKNRSIGMCSKQWAQVPVLNTCQLCPRNNSLKTAQYTACFTTVGLTNPSGYWMRMSPGWLDLWLLQSQGWKGCCFSSSTLNRLPWILKGAT